MKMTTKELSPAAFERVQVQADPIVQMEKQGRIRQFFRLLKKRKLTCFVLILLLILLLACIFAPLISPYDPNAIDATNRLQAPSKAHPFGTDEYGRDYFTRALYGGRVSLLVGFATMLVTTFVGVTIGLVSGYLGGVVDTLLMRFTDIFLALPSMLLMIVLNTLLSPSLPTLIATLSLFSWARVARITRAETMGVKNRDFVVASKKLGASNFSLLFGHILPNISGPIIVAASLGIAGAILSESSLSFIGLGVQIPHASWGSMLQNAQTKILDAPLMAVYPGLLIFITVLGFNLLGDVLRAVIAPKQEA